jgi:1-deoxy-D-xylulose-5-phosphate synthase
VQIEEQMHELPVGRGLIVREGRSGLAILAFGTMLGALAAIAEKHDATLVNMRFVKPLDEDLIRQLADRHASFVTAEENSLAGGAGAAVLETLSAHGYALPVLALGIPDRYIPHGSRADNLAAAGLDPAGLASRIERFWQPLQRRA